MSPGISRVLEQSRVLDEISNGYIYVFGVKLSSNGTSDLVGRRCVLEIQDGSQLTESSNIAKTVTYIIKIPTAKIRHSTMANSQEVYLGDSNNHRQSKMAAKTGNTYISETI